MQDEDKYFAGGIITAKYPVANVSTLRSWANSGRVRVIRSTGGKRFYHVDDVKRELGYVGEEGEDSQTEVIGYARVSSSKQKQDLERQIQYIRDHYETSSIIQDVGSGLNFNRRGLQTLLTKVESGSVRTVVVTYRDRLCRFGIELLERILRTNHTELLVLCTEEGSEEQELANDLLDIVNVFVARRNGRRGAQFRAARSNANQDLPAEPDEKGEQEVERVVPRHKVCVQPMRAVPPGQSRPKIVKNVIKKPIH
jgi:predicted site-specific integrase-resolvase